jgi:hypothetical protein
MILSYEELSKLSKEDMNVNEVNIMERQLQLCSKKHFVLGQKFEISREIIRLKNLIDEIITKVHEEENNKASGIEIISKKLIEKKVEAKLTPLRKEIFQLEILLDYVDGLLKVYTYATNDYKNIIEIIKLNNG